VTLIHVIMVHVDGAFRVRVRRQIGSGHRAIFELEEWARTLSGGPGGVKKLVSGRHRVGRVLGDICARRDAGTMAQPGEPG
jgi:hypothetical protein